MHIIHIELGLMFHGYVMLRFKVREKDALTEALSKTQESLRAVEKEKEEREETIKGLNMDNQESAREQSMLRAELENALEKTV